MAVQTPAQVSVEEFEKIAALPENAYKRLEYIGGAIVEVVSNSDSSEIAMRLGAEIRLYLKTNDLGRLTGADGGYRVSGEDYIPDVGFISKARQPKRPHVAWNPLAPDLAVEVVSPTDEATEIADKVANYTLAGTLLWFFFPSKQQVKVYAPGKPVKTLGINDTLDGGKILPGFKVALKDIFLSDE
ncbi:MAG TPA: Uma2 family endonuclease [Aggregatilineales bacterium]|nr:Uma2 family endonuclease [Aggregatilineales bacterium]